MKKKGKEGKAPKVPFPELVQYYQRWLKGESMTKLFADATAAGDFKHKKGKFRRSFFAIAGGKAAWQDQRNGGAGGKAEPFGGKRSGPGPKLDDSAVKVIVPKTGRLKGWSTRRIREAMPFTIEIDKEKKTGMASQIKAVVHISPKGNEYVKAMDSEKADLIIRYRTEHGALMDADVRLKRFAESSVARKLKKNEQELERGEAALKRIRARKKAAKLARKASKKKEGK